jgi:hypothetical protein
MPSSSEGIWHTVERGDCLSLLGHEHRIPWKKIWDHPDNELLRRNRGNPNILHPGDRVFIPTLEERVESCPTEKKHRFRTSGSTWLRIAVLDIDHKPVPDIAFNYIFDGVRRPPGKTDAEGIAESILPEGVRQVVLKLPWGEMPIEVAHLAPAHTVRGIQQRLRNLGVDPGPIDGLYGPLTARGISEFQALEGLPVNGAIDRSLIRTLRSVHERETLDGVCEELEQHDRERGEGPDRDAEPTISVGDIDDDPIHGPQGIGVDEDDLPPDFVEVT